MNGESTTDIAKSSILKSSILKSSILKWVKEFKDSRNNYGARKLKVELVKKNMVGSRRKTREIMKKYYLVSNYTVKQYKVKRSTYNEDSIKNIVNRKFNDRENLEVVVSNLTYVNVSGKWHYSAC